jgi:surfactin synthase thioesterase subunit
MQNIKKQQETKIIALPFAGASKYSYRVLQNVVSDNFEWIIYELPGRGERIKEDFLIEIDNIIDDIFEKMHSIFETDQYIIYGHSLGTILGYELVKRIIASNLPQPLFLFFTGRGSPSIYERENLADLDEVLFWEKVSEIGGLPKEILESEELKCFFGPVLRADFKAVENYVYKRLLEPLKIPIYACIGNEELIGDDKVKWDHILKWQNETMLPIDVEFFSGDHFFILKHPELIIKKMDNALKISKIKYDNNLNSVSEV